jgi:arylsulfatase
LSAEDIKRLQEVARAAGDAPSADAGKTTVGLAPQVSSNIGLGVLQKVELRLDKREGCRKQAEVKGLGMLERIQFVRSCMQ